MAKIIKNSNEAKANVATAQALKAGANPRDLEIARQFMGNKNYTGYCQAFVRQVTGGVTQGASAIEAWNNAPTRISGTNGLQPGDLVYFSPNASNKGFGHTGIYAGNDQFISATDKGIRSAGIGEWLKATGQKLLGYVPGSERALGLGDSNGSQQSGMAFSPPTPEEAISHHVQMRQSGMPTEVPIPTPPIPNMQNQGQNPLASQINLNPNQPNA